MNHLFRRQVFQRLYGLTIALLMIAMIMPSAVLASVLSPLSAPGIWSRGYQGSYYGNPDYYQANSGGANASDGHLYAVGFYVSDRREEIPARSFLYKLKRNPSFSDPWWVNEPWDKSGLYVDPDLTIARDVAADRRSDVYVVGETEGRGRLDAFVRKYRKDGRKLWTRRFHKGRDGAYATAVDSARNVYMVGVTDAPDGASSSKGAEGFIIKYNESGRKLWGRRFGSIKDDAAKAVAVDSRRNVYVAGITKGRMGRRYGGLDVFLRKYSRTGKHLWTRQFGTPKQEIGISMAVDGYGKIYVAGATKGNFRGLRRRSGQKFFLRKYDYRGRGLWTRQFGRASAGARHLTRDYENNDAQRISYMQGVYIAVDPGNNVYVSGATPRDRTHVQKFNRRGRSRWARDVLSRFASGLTADNSGHYSFWDSASGSGITKYHN